MAKKSLALFALNLGYLVAFSYAQTEQPSRSRYSNSNRTPRSGIGRRQQLPTPKLLFTQEILTEVTRLADTVTEDNTATLNRRSGEDGDGGDTAANSQMATIILSSVIGTIFLVVLGILLWHFYKKHQSKRHAMTRLETPNEHEFEKWRVSSMPVTPSVDKHSIPPSPLATPVAAQSHASKRYYSQPSSPHVFDRDRRGPRSGSSHGLLDSHNSFDSRPTSQNGNGLSDHAGHRYSRSANNVRGYMQHRAERSRSTQSLTTRRAPTPLFGDGITPEEENEIPHVSEPVRPRSTPLSPLAGSPSMSGDDFDFGFQQRRMTMEREKRYSNASEMSFNELPAAPPKNF
ncbi:hypothetical protein BLS_004058 [Venturia inaequalis]|uniref:Uncharacterized protein n=1 Tax=Venturia inaequalis TaxID=5025 RepID=A0A8H3UNE7_VENIN|nr:hypothetical protein BLS_004058 [Venturia inaequalis]KAE9973257.1 hypothetical protein EG327_009142 [Venturia inaequalis]